MKCRIKEVPMLYTYHFWWKNEFYMSLNSLTWGGLFCLADLTMKKRSDVRRYIHNDVTNIPCCVGSKVWCNPKILTPWCCIISKNIEKSILGHKSLHKYKNIDTMMQRYPQKSRDQSLSVSSRAIPKYRHHDFSAIFKTSRDQYWGRKFLRFPKILTP